MKYKLRMWHWLEGGTGITNFTPEWLESISKAMEICKIEGMTIVNRGIHPCFDFSFSLHICVPWVDSLDYFWEVEKKCRKELTS